MSQANKIWRPSGLSVALSLLLAGAYNVLIALCMFAPEMMGVKVQAAGGLSIAVLTSLGLLVSTVIAAIVYLRIANGADEDNQGGEAAA